MKRVIHVNQHIIKRNRKTGERAPVLTVKTYKSNDYAHEVEILGPCKIIYRPDKPLSCGAVVWIETRAELSLHLSRVGEKTQEPGLDTLDRPC